MTNSSLLTPSDGYYIYFESSVGGHGFKAQLLSPVIAVPVRRSTCLSFWYHMYGQHVNILNVYAKHGSALGSPVWTRTGTQGNQWLQAYVNVPSGTNMQVK